MRQKPDYAKALKEASAERAWRWSERFLRTLNTSMRDRPLDAAGLPDWHVHLNRLARWGHDVEQARKRYLDGSPAQLRKLFKFWRDLGRFHLWR